MSLQRTLELVAALDVCGFFYVCILLLVVVSYQFNIFLILSLCNLESLIYLDSVPYVFATFVFGLKHCCIDQRLFLSLLKFSL